MSCWCFKCVDIVWNVFGLSMLCGVPILIGPPHQESMCSVQGRIIMGILGTRFPGNGKVSQEVLIINPAHLLQKCDAPKTKRTQTS